MDEDERSKNRLIGEGRESETETARDEGERRAGEGIGIWARVGRGGEGGARADGARAEWSGEVNADADGSMARKSYGEQDDCYLGAVWMGESTLGAFGALVHTTSLKMKCTAVQWCIGALFQNMRSLLF